MRFPSLRDQKNSCSLPHAKPFMSFLYRMQHLTWLLPFLASKDPPKRICGIKASGTADINRNKTASRRGTILFVLPYSYRSTTISHLSEPLRSTHGPINTDAQRDIHAMRQKCERVVHKCSRVFCYLDVSPPSSNIPTPQMSKIPV